MLQTHILNMVVGCTEIPFFTVRCIQPFDFSLKNITNFVSIEHCDCQSLFFFIVFCSYFVESTIKKNSRSQTSSICNVEHI